MAAIQFFNEDISFKLSYPRKTIQWIKRVIELEGYNLESLSFVFCSDEHLHRMNVEYLNHTTLTDIITFDSSETKKTVEGDIFISIDRVRENATKFDVSFEEELRRVLIHGVLHLMGYKDKSSHAKKAMRKKEDACLSLWAK